MGYNNTLYSLLLPCIVIAIPNIGVFTSYIKNNLEIELREEYIKYLFVNGVKKFLVEYLYFKKFNYSSYSFNWNNVDLI